MSYPLGQKYFPLLQARIHMVKGLFRNIFAALYRTRPLLMAANLLLLVINLAFFLQPQFLERLMPPIPITPDSLPPPAPPAPADSSGKLLEGRLWPGASFDALLQRSGLPSEQAHKIVTAAKKVFDPRKLRAGNPYSLKLDENGALETLRYHIDVDRYVQIEKSADGWASAIQKIPLDSRKEVVSVQIEDNLFNALVQAGEKDLLAMKLADIFQWDVDFNTDLRQGNRFRVLVEKLYSDQELVRYGDILAAEITNQGKKIQAFRHAAAGRQAEYYDAAGRPLRKQMLKSPLPFLAPVTSRFSRSRFHPVLRIYRPHLGIDYGAPEGTPVLSMADGMISARGWDEQGGGNMIRIAHSGGISTTYMHLSRFSTDVGVGQTVKQGQTIGFVGSTGLATGPHLDFRIRQGNQFVNPIKVHGAPADPLPPLLQVSFFKIRDTLLRQMDRGMPTARAMNEAAQ